MRILTPSHARYLLTATKVRGIEDRIQERIARLDFEHQTVETLEAQVFAIERGSGYWRLVDEMMVAKEAWSKDVRKTSIQVA